MPGHLSGIGTPVRSDTFRASSIRPLATSHDTDSGIFSIANGSSVMIGSAPNRKSPRQPMESSATMARKDPNRLPSGTPE